MNYEVDVLAVGEGSKGDGNVPGGANLADSRAEPTAILIACGYTTTGDSIVNHRDVHRGS